MTDRPEISLDPEDWEAARTAGHRFIDAAVAHLAGLRERPAWQSMPPEVRAAYAAPAPAGPMPLAEVLAEMTTNLLPYPMGNVHPGFYGWYMGGGSFTGALGDFLAAIDGSNLGGGDSAASLTEQQVVGWLKEIAGFPASASGTLTSGGSMANLIGLTVARNAMAGVDVRAEGVTDLPQPLRFYASDQTHGCHQKSVEALGLGQRALRLVATDAGFRIDLAALEAAIAEDRAAGIRPACVIATAGTTNTGAFDDFAAIADLCRREGLWFHVDGCIGALLKLAPENRVLVDGIEVADSLALDPHKWLQTPFELGCALVRDRHRHFETFNLHPAYLELRPRGVIAAEFLADYGFELSRGFKALKLWMSLKENGTARFGALIDQSVRLGRHLADRVRAEAELELMAPQVINIVCFRYRGQGGGDSALKALNTEIMLRIQESGLAVPTDTTLNGRHSLRAAIVNHRTRAADLDALVDAVLLYGRALQAG